MPIYFPGNGSGSGEDFSSVEVGEIPYKVDPTTFDGRDYNSYNYDEEEVPSIGAIVVNGTTPEFIGGTNRDVEFGKSYRFTFYCTLESSISGRYGAIRSVIDGIVISTSSYYSNISGTPESIAFVTNYTPISSAVNVPFLIEAYCERSNQSITLREPVMTIEEL